MAILSREEYLNNIKARVGDDTSDDTIKFIEDMTDTFDEMSKNDYKERFEQSEREKQELDETWRKKYTERFYAPEERPKNDCSKSAESITIEDLFTNK